MTDLTARMLIRDGLPGDIASCLALDHTFETDRVWQMQVNEDAAAWEILFRLERLPRPVTVAHPGAEKRLIHAVKHDGLFLIAHERGTREPFGYLAMLPEPGEGFAHIGDLIVQSAYRREHIATRLLNVARRWAKERGLLRVHTAIGTKNHPAALFLEKAGFRRCGFDDRYFQNGDIALLYSCSLR
jgi:GNAT superfamily N-acetyltransferase